MNLLRNAEDAQECVNDTWHSLWETIPPQRPNYFFAYLAKICRFLCFGRLDWQNAQKRSAYAKRIELNSSAAEEADV